MTFGAAAVGPADAVRGQPLVFETGRGWHVSLTKARLHVGAVYLNRSVPSSGAQETSCVLPGIYVAQVLGGADVDALSPDAQALGARGDGTADHASAGELWLTGGDVNASDDTTVIADVAGTATQGATSVPFEAQVTIGRNRALPASDPSQPGAHPPCKQRIVTPIPVDLVPAQGGTLLVRVDPRGWLADVDFSELEQVSTSPPAYRIPDDSSTQPGTALFAGLHASAGVYTLTWTH